MIIKGSIVNASLIVILMASMLNSLANTLSPDITTKPGYEFLHAYTASYDITDGKKVVGQAHRRLQKKNNAWTLSMGTAIKKWFIKYRFEESSQFQIRDNQLHSLNYRSNTKSSLKADRSRTSLFDWQNNLERGTNNRKPYQLPLDALVFDHLNFQVALRKAIRTNPQDIELNVSYKGSRHDFHFKNQGEKTISTPLGNIKTILLVQEKKQAKDKQLLFWLAPKYQFIPIKIQQIKKGKSQGILVINNLYWDESRS